MKCTCCNKKIWFWQSSLYVKAKVYVHEKCVEDLIINRAKANGQAN
jgi:hypothetical protein